MGKYRLSTYNHFIERENGVDGVNYYKRIFFGIDNEVYKKLLLYKFRLEELEENNPTLFSLMYKLGVIEEETTDIPSILLLENREDVFSNSYFHLVILPTLNCNLSCWYCYETHNKAIMRNEIVTSVIKFVERTIVKDRIPHINIEWFGGEPLLGYRNVIVTICKEVKKICIKNNATFSMGITTNSALLNDSIVSFFKEHNINKYQITLDGNRESHDKTRFYGKDKKGTYDIIVKNICKLAEIENANILLRINYTTKNLPYCPEIINDIPENIRNKINLILVHVWQDKTYTSIHEREILNKNEMEIYNIFQKAGFKTKKIKITPHICRHTCYADRKNEAVINYDGRVFKCTTPDFEKTEEDGYLSSDGEIIWNRDKLSKRLARATFENDICMKCKCLPLCTGCCSTHDISSNLIDEKCIFKPRIEENIVELMNFFNKTGYKKASLFQIQQMLVQSKM
jgi:uncharacterized protein